jgi:hypothetical protein
MNFLVFLEPEAGELEKILSGTKCMVVKKFDPSQAAIQSVNPGDSLYFLRNKDAHEVRVKATVLRVLLINNGSVDEQIHTLNELQPKLQLTEEQYNRWSKTKQAQLVEFENAHKIDPSHISVSNINGISEWVAFEGRDLLT